MEELRYVMYNNYQERIIVWSNFISLDRFSGGDKPTCLAMKHKQQDKFVLFGFLVILRSIVFSDLKSREMR